MLVAASTAATDHIVVVDCGTGLLDPGTQRTKAITDRDTERTRLVTLPCKARVVALREVAPPRAVSSRERALGIEPDSQPVFLEERALQPEAIEP